MIEDKISLILKDLAKLKSELKDLKKDVKAEEKMDTEEYVDLKKAYKDMKLQLKDLEDQFHLELAKDDNYNKLREMVLSKEEEIANVNEKLFKLIAELPQKPFMMNVELEEGPVRVQIQPEMRVYLNGKEEKKRAA
jgi:hypothetical protein